MKLTKQEQQGAKIELLSLLLGGPKSAKELRKASHFHLSLGQVWWLMRETGKANVLISDEGIPLWALRKESVREVLSNEEAHLAFHKTDGPHSHDLEELEARILKAKVTGEIRKPVREVKRQSHF